MSTLVARKQREVPRSTSIKYVNKEKEDIIEEVHARFTTLSIHFNSFVST